VEGHRGQVGQVDDGGRVLADHVVHRAALSAARHLDRVPLIVGGVLSTLKRALLATCDERVVVLTFSRLLLRSSLLHGRAALCVVAGWQADYLHWL
jgi:hypothetical protein